MALADIPDSQLARRARNYWNVDGIPILVGALLYLGVVGCFFVLFSVLMWQEDFTGNRVFEFLKPVATLAFVTFPFWILLAIVWLSVNWEDVIEWFKVRLTYPRTGYVAPPSYWQSESASPTSPEEKTGLAQWLSGLELFWNLVVILWLFSDLPPLRWVRIVLLGVLLAIRALRFGLYSETPIVDGGRNPGILVQVARFLRFVLNSFWVWVLLIGLLPPLKPAVVALVWLGIVLALSLSAFLTLRPMVGRFQAACLCLCIPVCAFLFWRGSLASIVVASLMPGLCAVFVGGLRLYRYLHANPARSI